LWLSLDLSPDFAISHRKRGRQQHQKSAYFFRGIHDAALPRQMIRSSEESRSFPNAASGDGYVVA
jgi:hypothetical protein